MSDLHVILLASEGERLTFVEIFVVWADDLEKWLYPLYISGFLRAKNDSLRWQALIENSYYVMWEGSCNQEWPPVCHHWVLQPWDSGWAL